MATLGIRRPRNVNWQRAGAILYGDWGTSKAYVVGIAFALAGYSSLWMVLAVCILTAIVGFNYTRVCKYYPDGGGVYSSAKAHSQKLALLGGLLLCADYIVTAALSCLDAFHYFGFSDPVRWAVLTIFFVGVLNFFGPKHSGSMALVFAVPVVLVVVLLAIVSIPHLGEAHVEPPSGAGWHNWGIFVGLILTLSGVESVANMTGVMEMESKGPGAPTIDRTVHKTIWPVLIEVCLFTALLALAMHALPGLTVDKETHHVLGPNHLTDPHQRELEASMLRYMGEVFVGKWFAWIVSAVFGLLLLSATNTAIVGTVSVLFLMSRDGQLPWHFANLNRFGVPWVPLLIATIIPLLVLDAVSGVQGLAALYAIGVVGAITLDLGSSAFNRSLPMKQWERALLLGTSLLLTCVWLTIAFTKPLALLFAVLVVGLGWLITSKWVKGSAPEAAAGFDTESGGLGVLEPGLQGGADATNGGAILVAARGATDVLKFAVDEAALRRSVLYVLYVREIHVTIPTVAHWRSDPQAAEIFHTIGGYARQREVRVLPVYTTSDSPAQIILDLAATLGVEFLIMGGSQRSRLVNLLKGNVIGEVARHLPQNIRLLIYG